MKQSFKHIVEVASGITLFVLLTTLVIYISETESEFVNYFAEQTLSTLVITLTITIIVIALLNIKSNQNK